MTSTTTPSESVIIHLIVVGFHHKKGCLVDYCYPPIVSTSTTTATTAGDHSGTEAEAEPEAGIELPALWRTLPQLSLPDGAHNHERDTIYFHLPDLLEPGLTVFGISCYRQIPSDRLLARTSDMTRGTVQKSVVVLSRLPLYGHITAKLEMITHAYFRELDFSKVGLLEETYHSLNGQLHAGLLRSPGECHVGLSPRELVVAFRHRTLVLFKLLLLERKVLFYGSPVRELCSAILALCSLVPGLIETGLAHSALTVHPKHSRQPSSDVELASLSDCETEKPDNSEPPKVNEDREEEAAKDSDDDLLKEIDEALSNKSDASQSPHSQSSLAADRQSVFYDTGEPAPERIDRIADSDRATPPLLKLPAEECGLPLELFSCGAYCHPYLSLTYLDVLTDCRVRSCLVGATNFLFKQKRDIFDVIVELDSAKIEVSDPELRKQLSLTTEDLRFADYLVRNVLSDGENGGADIFMDGTEWEGSDDWIRYQFKVYLLHMLRSSELDESSRDYLSFSSNFMAAWRSTHSYKIWSSVSRPGVFEVSGGHPFGGNLSVNDMRLRLNQLFYSKTDQNRRLNQTVSRTSKAVGGAIVSAKSAVSSWWSTWSSPSTSAAASQSPVSAADSEKPADESKKFQVTEAETQL